MSEFNVTKNELNDIKNMSKRGIKGTVVGLNCVLGDDFKEVIKTNSIYENLRGLGQEHNFTATEKLKCVSEQSITHDQSKSRKELPDETATNLKSERPELDDINMQSPLDQVFQFPKSENISRMNVESEPPPKLEMQIDNMADEEGNEQNINKLEKVDSEGSLHSEILDNILNLDFKGVKSYLSSADPLIIYETLIKMQNIPQINEVVEKVCGALVLEPSLFKEYSTVGLRHVNHEINSITLQCLIQLAQTAEVELFVDNNLILGLIKRMKDDSDLECAKLATSTLILFASTDRGSRIIFNDQHIQDELRETMKELCRFRCFKVIVAIATKSEGNMCSCVSLGLFDHLLNELQTADIWIRSNVIELLTPMVIFSPGLEYLEKKGVIDILDGMLYQVETNAVVCLILPSLITFYGHLIYSKPAHLIAKYQGFIGSLHLELMSCKVSSPQDYRIKEVSMSALAIIASNSQNKLSLSKQDTFNKTLNALGTWLTNDDSDLIAAAIECIGALLTISPHPAKEPINESEDKVTKQEITRLTEEWFRAIFPPKLVEDKMEKLLEASEDHNNESQWIDLNIICLLFKVLLSWPTWGHKYIRDNYLAFWEECMSCLNEDKFKTDAPLEINLSWKILFINMVQSVLGIPQSLSNSNRLKFIKQATNF